MQIENILRLGAIVIFITALVNCSPTSSYTMDNDDSDTNLFFVESVITDVSSTVEVAFLTYKGFTMENASTNQEIVDTLKKADMSDFTSTKPQVATVSTPFSYQGRVSLSIHSQGTTQIDFLVNYNNKSYPVQFIVTVNAGPFSVQNTTTKLEKSSTAVYLAYYGKTTAFPDSEIISIMDNVTMNNFVSQNSRVVSVDTDKSRKGVIHLNLFEPGRSIIYFDVYHQNKTYKLEFDIIVE